MDLDAILGFVSGHQWIPLAALAIGLTVRALKEDTKVLPTIPSKYRRALAVGLGCAAGVLQLVAVGASWRDAVVTAVVAPLLAIAGHHLGIDVLRGGREIPIPGLMRKPPGTPGAGPTVLLVLVSLLTWGCGGGLGQARSAGRVGLPPDSPRCQALDDRQATWSGVAQGAGVLAGGSGLGGVVTDDERARLGLGIGAAVAGATAALAVALADGSARAWARECSGGVK